MTHFSTQAERWSHSAWRNLGLTAPVDLRRVCDYLGYELARDTLPPGALGLFLRSNQGKRVVIVSESLSIIEQRKIIAHEIGHGISVRKLPGAVEFHCSTYNRDEPAEREADLFARHLLVPTEQLHAAVTELGHTNANNRIGTLAGRFEVDIELVQSRLYECGILPDWRRK